MRRAVRERAEHQVDVVKIMTSGGIMTASTDVTACQFTLEELRVLVQEAHDIGLPVTAHAHAVAAIEQSVDAGVDGIEHCSCMTTSGLRTPTDLAARIADAGIVVCPNPRESAGGTATTPDARDDGQDRLRWEDRIG